MPLWLLPVLFIRYQKVLFIEILELRNWNGRKLNQVNTVDGQSVLFASRSKTRCSETSHPNSHDMNLQGYFEIRLSEIYPATD